MMQKNNQYYDEKRTEFLNRMQEYNIKEGNRRQVNRTDVVQQNLNKKTTAYRRTDYSTNSTIGNAKSVNTIEHIEKYIKELESKRANIEEINKWKRLKKYIEEKNNTSAIASRTGNKTNIGQQKLNKGLTEPRRTYASQQGLDKKLTDYRRTSRSSSATIGKANEVKKIENNQYEDERTAFLNRMQGYAKTETNEVNQIRVEEEITEEPDEKRTIKSKIGGVLLLATLGVSLALSGYSIGYEYGVKLGNAIQTRREAFLKEDIEKMLKEYEEYEEEL